MLMSSCNRPAKETIIIMDQKAASQVSPHPDTPTEKATIQKTDEKPQPPSSEKIIQASDQSSWIAVNENKNILLSKDALDKSLVWDVKALEQTETIAFRSFKSRLVHFRKRGARLILVEASAGHMASKSDSGLLTLGEFPILSETEAGIEIDFGGKMDHLFVTPNSDVTDGEKAQYNSDSQFVALALEKSYTDRTLIDQGGALVLWQGGMLRSNDPSDPVKKPFQVQHVFRFYVASKTYAKKPVDPRSALDYFASTPLYEQDGNAHSYYQRLDISKKHVIHLSNNTPNEFIGPITEGIQYWNKAFGKEVFTVATNSTNSTNEHSQHLISWVDWKTADRAYADWNSDPMTGEVTRLQIFLPSMWAFEGGEKFAQYIALTGKKPTKALGKKSLMYAQDFVRSVVTHEIGHTLGLAHQFGGSQNATPQYLANREKILKTYYETGNVPLASAPADTVMDYLNSDDEMVLGALLQARSQALPYDQIAIDRLYDLGKKNPDSLTIQRKEAFTCNYYKIYPLFYTDCQPFDIGHSVVEFAKYGFTEALSDGVFFILGRYKKELQRPQLNVLRSLAMMALKPKLHFLKSYEKNATLMPVIREFRSIDDLNIQEAREKKFQILEEEIQKLGGLEAILRSNSISEVDSLRSKAIAFMASSKKDSSEMIARIFNGLTHELELISWAVYTNVKFDNHPSSKKIEAFLEKEILNVALSVESNSLPNKTLVYKDLKTKKILTKIVSLYPWKKTLDIRMTAITTLNPKIGLAPDWGAKARTILWEHLNGQFKEFYGVSAEQVYEAEQTDPQVKEWVQEFIQMIAYISKLDKGE